MSILKKKVIIVVPILLAVIALVCVYLHFNTADETTSLTVSEKRWIEKNSSSVSDFEVINNFPLYGMDGEGVFFQFIDDFEKNTGMEFNKISYLKETNPTGSSYRIRILNNEDNLSDKDLLFFEDSYVAIGKTYQRINHISDMKDYTFGVLATDIGELSYYLKSGSNLSYKTYATITDLYQALNAGDVHMIIVPNIMYLNNIIGQAGYSINYYFTEMSKKIVLTLSEDNAKLNTIVKKYYQHWKENNYVKEYNKAFLDYYVQMNNLNNKTEADLLSKNYVYGYVENEPYEVLVDGKVNGIAGEYLNRLSRLTDIEFTYRKYDSIQKLEEAVQKGEVDVYFDYYNFHTNEHNYLPTVSTFVEEYVVLGKTKDEHIVNSFESLKGKNIAMLEKNALYSYFADNGRATITTYANLNTLKRKAKNQLIVLDKEVYQQYKNSMFQDYQVLYQDTMMNDYKFVVKQENKTFYDLFNYVINTNSYYRYRNTGINSIHQSIFERSNFSQLYLILLALIFAPLFAIAIIYMVLKRKKNIKEVKKEDRRKYTDMLTSLKNRNYLNFKMDEWDNSKVYPQAIAIIDLNNVKYVNDNYGHEAGDNLIIKAASVLINTQLENTEIIRTDGNEFLIYLVGYSEQQMETYAKKLTKEFKKELPYEFGAAVGYSMIMDDIKTIDDAINEATLAMRQNKEESK